MRYRFGSITLDLSARELLDGGRPVELEPRTHAVLAHLIEHRDRVVTKEELLDEVWGDHFVGESALTTQIKHARAAIGDDGQSQRLIKTVHRVGYRFVGEVSDEASSPKHPATAAASGWEAQPSPALFGREADIDRVELALATHRLVTITGPGGVGKTRVARCLHERMTDAAPDGAWICELADIRDAEALGNIVLATLGYGQQSDADPDESLMRALETSRSLLILDNCEHVLAATRELVTRLLDRCPDVRILATSRMPLGVSHEVVHPLDPLELDDAVACFASLVTQVGASVEASDPAVADLCRRLDCLPLALELAAAHARLLTPVEMLGHLADRFALLRDGTRELEDRHRSLHRTIAWSWDRLLPPDQELLAKLTTFVGLFSLDDVRAVALPDRDPFDVIDALGRLVSRSLVVSVPAAAGQTRFRLLESVREFAGPQLRDARAVRRRHAAHFATHAESLDVAFQTDQIDSALTAMRMAWNNLRAAVGYAVDDGDIRTVHRIIRATGPYADVFQVFEVLDWCDRVHLDLAHVEESDGVGIAADALAVKARMLAHRGRHTEGRLLADAAFGRCESHATLLSVVWCAYYAGDLDLVVHSAERLVELSRSERGFDRGFADGFSAIVTAVRQEADIASTVVSPDDADRGILGTQDCLTEGLRLCTTDPERAAALLEAVVESALRNDYRLHLGAAASTLTQITLPGRPAREAMRTLRKTLQLYLDRSMWPLISADTVMAARLLADLGEVETACRLLGSRVASGYAVGLSEVLRELLQADLESRLGDRFDELAAQGARWRPPEAGRAAVAALERVLADPTPSPA